MNSTEQGKLAISEDGRSGRVTYSESTGELSFYWEFGGGDVIAIVQTGTAEVWRKNYPWASARRSEILRFIAAEVRRQKAPSSRAEINELSGDILFRQVAEATPPVIPPQHAWYYRLREFKMKLALAVLAVALGFVGLAGVKAMLFEIDPGKGTSLGESVRTEQHIATLIQTLEAYTPTLHRDAGKDRYTVSVYIVPLEGDAPELVELRSGLRPSEFALAKVLGSDGERLWVDVSEVMTVDLSTYEVKSQADAVPDDLQGRASTPFPIRPETFLSAGFLSTPTAWMGLHSADELAGEYALQKFVRRLESAETEGNKRQPRQLYRAAVEPDSSEKYYQLLSMDRVGTTEYINAAFLRMDEQSEPLRLSSPDSALMLFTSDAGLKGTAVMARIDLAGAEVWRTDTGIDRFKLSQILPGSDVTALVGTRPSEDGKVPEPLLVLVDHATGEALTHSLWQ